MARISSIGTRMLFAKTTQTGINITLITKANPPVVTISGTLSPTLLAMVQKGWIRLASTVDLPIDTLLPNFVYRVASITNTTNATFTLPDVDLSGLGANITPVAGEAKAYPIDWVPMDATSATRESPPAAEVDLTTLEDTARVTAAGLPNSGTFNVDGFFNYSEVGNTSGFAGMLTALNDGERRYVVVTNRDDTALVLQGTQTQLGESWAVDAGVGFTAQLTLSGSPAWHKPAGVVKNYNANGYVGFVEVE